MQISFVCLFVMMQSWLVLIRSANTNSISILPLKQTKLLIRTFSNAISEGFCDTPWTPTLRSRKLGSSRQKIDTVFCQPIQWNKLFHRMYGLARIEVMTMSGHLSNIDEILKCDLKRVLSHFVNTRTSLPQTQLFKTENWHRFPSTAMFLFSLSLVLVIIVIISTLFVLQLGVPLGHSKFFFWFFAVFCSDLELV